MWASTNSAGKNSLIVLKKYPFVSRTNIAVYSLGIVLEDYHFFLRLPIRIHLSNKGNNHWFL